MIAAMSLLSTSTAFAQQPPEPGGMQNQEPGGRGPGLTPGEAPWVGTCPA